MENFTSAEVIGVPLLKLTPCLSLNVQVRWSSDWVQLSASQGSTFWPSWLPIVSPSNIWL